MRRRPALRVLTVSSLYPNGAMPSFGVFVENRLRHLIATGEVEARVVAPVPWFPFAHPRFGAYARWAAVPRAEFRHGLAVDHPRYLVLPRVGLALQAGALFRSLRRRVGRLLAEGHRFDLIDAHYYYPDGVAAVRLGRLLGVPVVVTARGTDVNLYPREFPRLRRAIARAAAEADASVAVCAALGRELVGLGANPGRVVVLRNGVDLDLFRPLPRGPLRARLGLGEGPGPVLASVGHLVERKGHDLVVGALPRLPGHRLLLVGEGPERAGLEAQARRLGVADRVRLLGAVPHERMAEVYGAADALVLASSREGWANVLLEAMACGTPVVASDIWGTPEVVAAPEAGRLLGERSAAGVAAAVRALLADPPPRAATRRYAEGFSWDATARGQVELFRAVLDRRRREGGREGARPAAVPRPAGTAPSDAG